MNLYASKNSSCPIQKFNGGAWLLAALVLACLAISPMAQAVSPAPDGGYGNGNTAEGTNALFSLTNGATNTATGFQALDQNTTGVENTADGVGALLENTTGNFNTANGFGALSLNTVGNDNTAAGYEALSFNTTGGGNTATGHEALFHNTLGGDNTAVGDGALSSNTTAGGNTAIGGDALASNTTGNSNVAVGVAAGFNSTTGSNNVYIGVGMQGVAGESNACYVASIFGQTSASGAAVSINSSGKLGTMTSSRRFKDGIKPMDKSSEAVFALNPVTFHYKKEIDATGTSQFGLVAEEVEKVNPDLVVRDKEGKPYSVRYDQVNTMLLNEFLKEHRTVQELKSNAVKQEATIARLEQQIEALTAGLQKVSAQLAATSPSDGGLELNKVAPQMAKNND
jgi:Chaperone of endosialidase